MRWTRSNINRLLFHAEKHDRYEIAKLMGLHPKTVANRLSMLGTRPQVATLSLNECVRRTGYLKHQLYRAKHGLNQLWRGGKRNGAKLGITEDQLDAMCEWLKYEGTHDVQGRPT